MKIPTTLDRKTNKLRFFTFALAVWLLIAAMPISAFAELLELETQPMGDQTVYVLAEDTTKRNEFEKHYYCSDGTFVAVTYPEAVHYKDENGEWVDVDMRLASDASTASYESQSGDFKTVFRTPAASGDVSVMANGTTAATPAISMQSGDHSLSWSLSGTKFAAPAGTSTYSLNPNAGFETVTLSASDDAQIQVLGDLKTSEPAVSVEKVPVTDPDAFALPAASNQVIYEDVFGADQNVSVRYSVSLNKIEEDILITAPTEMTSFSMQVACGELTPVLNDDNSVDFVDELGNMVYHVSIPYLVDAAFVVNYDVAVTLTEQDGVCTITYTPDAEWMNAPEREYPIMLDPAVTTSDYTTAIVDTYVESNTEKCYYTNQYLYINQNDGAQRMALMQITGLPNIDSSMPILSAKLDMTALMYLYSANSVDLKLEAFSTDFNMLMVKYTDVASLTKTEIDRCTFTNTSANLSFDLTSCITDLYTDNLSGYFAISLAEDFDLFVPPIYSSEELSVSVRPRMTITYGYSLPAGLAAGDEITIKNHGSQGYLYPNSGLIGNGNLVLHAPGTTTSDSYKLLTLRQNSANGTYRLEYTASSNSSGGFISVDTTTQKIVMYNTTNVPSNIKQDWLIVPYDRYTFKIVLASDMRYVMTAVGATSNYISDPSTATYGYTCITLCTGNPTIRQKWNIYEDYEPKENDIASTDEIDSGYYYFNCSYLGYFMYAQDATVDAVPGRVSELGQKIMWKITQYSDGYYLIQNATDESKLLTATGSGVEMVTSYGTINDSQKWTIIATTYGRVFSNAYYKDDVIETETSPYGVWRLKKRSEYVELDTFSFKDCTVGIGDSVVSSIESVTPVGSGMTGSVDYASPDHDFLYRSRNESIATVDERTGVVYGENRGVATIEVIHRVTGVLRTFDVTVEKKAIIVVPGLGGSELFVGADNPFFKEGAPILSQEMLDALSDLQDGLSFEQIAALVGGYVLIVPIPLLGMTASAYAVKFVNKFYDTLQCNDDGTSQYDIYTKKYVFVEDQNPDENIVECVLPDGYDSDIYTPHAGVYDTYYNLMAALHSDTSLTSKYSIEFFSYDWRLSNGYSAERLDAFIEENNYDKVILIAHSMGGLVASGYMGLGTEQLEKVEKVCMISSPLEGTPEVVNAWANVDVSTLLGDKENKIVNVLNKILPVVTLTQDPLQNMISNYPSIYELIPTEEYISLGGAYILYREISGDNVTGFTCYDYESSKQVVAQFLPCYNPNLMEAAEAFHTNCVKTEQDLENETDWKYFYVTGVETAEILECEKSGAYFEVRKNSYAMGDSLVPEWSATAGENGNSVKEYVNLGHNSIIKKKTDDIIRFLKGEL